MAEIKTVWQYGLAMNICDYCEMCVAFCGSEPERCVAEMPQDRFNAIANRRFSDDDASN